MEGSSSTLSPPPTTPTQTVHGLLTSALTSAASHALRAAAPVAPNKPPQRLSAPKQAPLKSTSAAPNTPPPQEVAPHPPTRPSLAPSPGPAAPQPSAPRTNGSATSRASTLQPQRPVRAAPAPDACAVWRERERGEVGTGEGGVGDAVGGDAGGGEEEGEEDD
ncbi:hypothetical protein V492_01355 [Pseudogymnoascus sp. VKM F-4246]|nr:hypothetical protein V492_01355 [Pseudogymnoascus sp. VKM F-4246]